MIIAPFLLSVVENEDFGPLVFTYYTTGTTLFDFTGYSAVLTIRAAISDASPIMALTPTLGGSAGTLSISWTAAQATTMVGAIPSLSGISDVLLTSPGGTKSHFWNQGPVLLTRSVTR